MKKLSLIGEKWSWNKEILHKAMHVHFHEEKIYLPTQGHFKWNVIYN